MARVSEVRYITMANFKSAILTTGTATTVTAENNTYVAPIKVHNEDRMSFQFYNPNDTAGHINTIKVYGRLGATTGSTLGATQYWTQIGDDIVCSGSASVLKAISTTGLSWVGVLVSGTTEFSANNEWAVLRQA